MPTFSAANQTHTCRRRPSRGGNTGRTPSARRAPGFPFLAALLVLPAASLADYVRGSVSVGGYFVDAVDAAEEGPFYQQERLSLGVKKGEYGLNFLYGYSDLQDKRPNSYAKSHRLSLANATYAPAQGWLQVTAGRDFAHLLDRSKYFDGASAELRVRDVQFELFGGYGAPTLYDEDVFDFDRDKALIGGKLLYSPIPRLQVYADGLVNGRYDDGTLGLEARGQAHERVTLTGGGVFRRDSSAISRADASALIAVRQQDLFQIRYGWKDERVDSSRSYAYFVNAAHQLVSGGYVFYWNKDLQVDLDYGAVFYEEDMAHLLDFRVHAYGLFLGAGKEWATIPDALNLRAGYARLIRDRVRLDLGTTYSLYDLGPTKLDLTAFDASARVGYLPGWGLEVFGGYEFLHNRVYAGDHRFFAGLQHAFFKGLSK